MKALIIEDEQPAARRLLRLLNELDNSIEILATIDSVEEAVEFFNSGKKPDLVFMDIQLADGVSFSIFEQCTVPAPVIFTTAYDQFALRAFKVNSVDYLLKPIEEPELQNALTKYKSNFSSENGHINYAEIIKALKKEKAEFKKRFLIKTGGRLTFILTDDISYFFSDDGNSFIVTNAGDRFLLENTLDEIESQVDDSVFFRINRKMIIALTSIQRIEPYLNNRYSLEVKPPFEEEVIVSRQRGNEFKNWLDQ